MVNDMNSYQRIPVQTDVSVYLDDPMGNSVYVVCDGTSIHPHASIWQRAESALASPTPRGPYPVARAFTIFVHETAEDVVADTRILRTVCIHVVCEGALVRATLQTALETRELHALAYLIGDDVVTTARRLLRAADDCGSASGRHEHTGEADS